MQHEDLAVLGVPESWKKGELLNLMRFKDGSFRAVRLGDKEDSKEGIDFTNGADAQEFVSWWYQRENGR